MSAAIPLGHFDPFGLAELATKLNGHRFKDRRSRIQHLVKPGAR